MNTIIIVLVVCITSCVRPERFGMLQEDGSILHFDETFDRKTNTSLVVFETKETELNTIQLNVFSKGFEVIKEVKRRICLIAQLNKPKYITSHLLATPPRKQYRIDHTDLQYTDVMNLAGSVAADFCRGYTTRFLFDTTTNTSVKRSEEEPYVDWTVTPDGPVTRYPPIHYPPDFPDPRPPIVS